MRLSAAILILALFSTATLAARAADSAPISKEGLELFEKHIRPVLSQYCYECHSSQSKKLKGKLLLDSRQGIAKGGENGPVLVPGNPDASRLITAMRWTDEDLEMPPKQKLTAQQIEKFEQWVRLGAPDPRDANAAAATKAARETTSVENGRKWWAFQPVAERAAPAVKKQDWAKRKIDAFVLAELEAAKVAPSPEADPRTLIRRAYLDLTGLRPTYEQVEAFAKDPTPAAYSAIVENLLSSPQYGERWGRYWLDVARYGEDNPTSEATNPPYPFAWRYRDWVIQALNQDVPYDRFVKLQLAADLMPGVPRKDLAALSFLGAAPVYHKDGRLSKDVIETLYTDDWDERVDTVTRGLLGLTVACARCHDHKFDPIPTRDYYSLAGVFASTVATLRPLADVDQETETRFMAAGQRIFYLSYVANLLRGEPGSKPREAREKVERYTAEMDKTLAGMSFLRRDHAEMYNHLAQLAKRPDPYPGTTRPAAPASRPVTTQPAFAQGQFGGRRGRFRGGSNEPFVNAVYDAGLWVSGVDADLTMIDIKPGQPRDMSVLPGGNVAKPGAPTPRGFLTVLSKSDPTFHSGSGRLELAERIFTDAAPLAARVLVNSVWAWHFGKPLVATPSDFGAQGEKPTYPQLLDDVAARFIANGWSLKWLHREIMLSTTYRQASRPRPDALKVDPGNRLLWRMNPRRLDIEAYRDNLLQAAGTLDRTGGGPSTDLENPDNRRRTVYARMSRGRPSPLLALYDFPEATMHSPSRETTTTPLQQLFAMNSPFMQDQAAALVRTVEKEPDAAARVRAMYRKVLARDPTDSELARATAYLATGNLVEFAHALLDTNEVIFWP